MFDRGFALADVASRAVSGGASGDLGLNQNVETEEERRRRMTGGGGPLNYFGIGGGTQGMASRQLYGRVGVPGA